MQEKLVQEKIRPNSKVKIPYLIYGSNVMRPAWISICALLFFLAFLWLPAAADDCGCNSGPGDDSGGDAGESVDGESGDEDSSSDSWDVTDSSWYSDFSGGDDPGSEDSSDTSDYTCGSGNVGASGADGHADDAYTSYLHARQYYEEGRYEESLEAYNASVTRDPYNKRVWMGRGELLLELGYYQAAQEAFQQVTKLDPAEYEAYFLTGEALYHMGAFEDSVTMYDRALAVNPLFDPAREQKLRVLEALAGLSTGGDEEKEPSLDSNGYETGEEQVVETPAGIETPEMTDTGTGTGSHQAAGLMPHTVLFAICILLFLAITSTKKR